MSDKHSAGKGDRYRKVDMKKWDENWKSVFTEEEKKLIYNMDDLELKEYFTKKRENKK